MSAEICEYLEWDSDFFGIRAARLSGDSLTPDRAELANCWCEAHQIDCLYFLANSGDSLTPELAQAYGFQWVDIRVTLERAVSPDHTVASGVRPFVPCDGPRLREIARVSHRDSRFYYDSRFPRSRCDALYETWIERSCNGWADTVLVAESDGRPSGYISCHLAPSAIGSIGLVAVAEDARGKGLGRTLVEAALTYFSNNGMSKVKVVTQGRNISSQRLYQRCGFLTQAVHLWYHRWLRTPA